MAGKRKKLTRSTGVTLEVSVINYLQHLADQEERDRSYCLNRIVREHAARQGTPLPPSDIERQDCTTGVQQDN